MLFLSVFPCPRGCFAVWIAEKAKTESKLQKPRFPSARTGYKELHMKVSMWSTMKHCRTLEILSTIGWEQFFKGFLCLSARTLKICLQVRGIKSHVNMWGRNCAFELELGFRPTRSLLFHGTSSQALLGGGTGNKDWNRSEKKKKERFGETHSSPDFKLFNSGMLLFPLVCWRLMDVTWKEQQDLVTVPFISHRDKINWWALLFHIHLPHDFGEV